MIIASHPFRRRSLNGLDERGREGCATCSRPPDHHPAPVEAPLLDLAHVRLAELLDAPPSSTLDATMLRLFDPRERDLLTVCAFSSAL
jgi:hypothetical protein